MLHAQQLVLYPIYRLAGEFIVRRWDAFEAAPHDQAAIFARAASLEEVRRMLPEGLYNMGPFAFEDPTLAEVWL